MKDTKTSNLSIIALAMPLAILPTIVAPFDFLACNSNGGDRPQAHANRREQMRAAGVRIRVSFMIKFKRCSRRVFRPPSSGASHLYMP